MSGQACDEKQVLTNKQTETSENDSEEGNASTKQFTYHTFLLYMVY